MQRLEARMQLQKIAAGGAERREVVRQRVGTRTVRRVDKIIK